LRATEQGDKEGYKNGALLVLPSEELVSEWSVTVTEMCLDSLCIVSEVRTTTFLGEIDE
jgi:hypothetical protein